MSNVNMFVTVTGMFIVGELINENDLYYEVSNPMMLGFIRQEESGATLVPYPPYPKDPGKLEILKTSLLSKPYVVTDELSNLYHTTLEKFKK